MASTNDAERVEETMGADKEAEAAEGAQRIPEMTPYVAQPSSAGGAAAQESGQERTGNAPSSEDTSEVEQADTPRYTASSGRRSVDNSAYGSMPAGIKFLFLGSITTITFVGLYQVRGIFGPIFFALTLVLTVRPIHRWLVKKRVPMWLSAVATLTTIACALLLIVALMTWSLVGLPDVVKSYAPAFQDAVDSVLQFAQNQGFATDQITEQVLGALNVSQALTTVMTAAGTISSVGSFVAVIALALMFITVDSLTMNTRARVVKEHDSMLYASLASFEGRVRQYWLVSTIFGLIVAIVNGIVLYFLDVPMPVAWALFSFITNYVPNIGFIIGVIPPALMGALDSGWLTGVWVIVAYSIINAVIQGIFQPKITGEAVGLSSIVTFISLLFWTVAIGPIGAILAVPLTLFAKALLVDSSAKTRWMGAFLVPESEAERRSEDGFFSEEAPTPYTFVDFTAEESEEGKRLRTKLQTLSLRKRVARTEQN